MNTLGAVCSKLLPVGDRATGNPSPCPPPPHPCHHTMPLPLYLTSITKVLPAHPLQLILAPAVKPSTWTFNQIKIHISVLSAFRHSWAAATKHISYIWGSMDWQLRCLCIGIELVLYDLCRRSSFLTCVWRSVLLPLMISSRNCAYTHLEKRLL